MSEPRDLETELAGMQPQHPSPQLKLQIGNELSASIPLRSVRKWVLIAGGAIIAASLALMLAGKGDHSKRGAGPATADRQAPTASDVRPGLPTVRTYQRALNESPEALDALLAKHAALAQMADSHSPPLPAFPRSNADLHALIGDSQ